jgi:hypothetical protein
VGEGLRGCVGEVGRVGEVACGVVSGVTLVGCKGDERDGLGLDEIG